MQHALTVIAKIKPDRAAELEGILDAIGTDIRGNAYLRLEDIETLQFGRWVMIPNQTTGQMEHLLFTSNYDGSLEKHLNEFMAKASDAMDSIWGCCEGYPASSTPASFREFIQKNTVRNHAFYIGDRYETLTEKKAYIHFRDELEEFFNLPEVARVSQARLKDKLNDKPQDALKAFDDIPAAKQFYDDRLKPAMDQLPKSRRAAKPNLFTWILLVLDFIWTASLYLIWYPLTNLFTGSEPALNLNLADLVRQSGITDIEDVVTQNQLTVLSRVKPGIFVLLKLKIVLALIHIVAKYFQNQGSLGGIATIHFARWAIIDKGRWLLFTSNYDGSWDSYIGDFVDKAASGMDLIWRSAPRYPAQGSKDIEAFKHIIRVNQVRTQVFYSSVPGCTMFNLLNNTAIANQLHDDRAGDWLRRL